MYNGVFVVSYRFDKETGDHHLMDTVGKKIRVPGKSTDDIMNSFKKCLRDRSYTTTQYGDRTDILVEQATPTAYIYTRACARLQEQFPSKEIKCVAGDGEIIAYDRVYTNPLYVYVQGYVIPVKWVRSERKEL